MKARGRATGVASGARAGGPHGNHLYPKWSSVPPDHLGHLCSGQCPDLGECAWLVQPGVLNLKWHAAAKKSNCIDIFG